MYDYDIDSDWSQYDVLDEQRPGEMQDVSELPDLEDPSASHGDAPEAHGEAEHRTPFELALNRLQHDNTLSDNMSQLFSNSSDRGAHPPTHDGLRSFIPIPGPSLGDSSDAVWITDLGHEHFDPSHVGPDVIGSPADEMTHWRMQDHSDTCAVASQGFIIESLTNEHVSETDLMQEAAENGWYTPGGGTPLDDVGELLEDHGIQVEQESNSSMSDLSLQLAEGHKVIAAVNGEEIWGVNGADSSNMSLADYPGIPGQAPDHAVEVIGIDNTDPAHPMVILNDPGTPDGCGLAVPEDRFERAWATSNHFMVHTVDSDSSGFQWQAPPPVDPYNV